MKLICSQNKNITILCVDVIETSLKKCQHSLLPSIKAQPVINKSSTCYNQRGAEEKYLNQFKWSNKSYGSEKKDSA